MTRIIVVLSVYILIITNFDFADGRPEYTNKEKAALIKFRELVKDATYNDYMLSDPYLIRWIRARNFDLNAASKMLRAALKWRKDNKIDGILDEKIHEFQSSPFYTDGIDYEGSTVLTMLPARVDMRRVLLSGKRSEAIRYWDQLCEKGEQDVLIALGIIGNSTDNTRDRPEVSTVILDLHGYSLRQHATIGCFAVYLEWFQHLENYYPRYSKHVIMINGEFKGPVMYRVSELDMNTNVVQLDGLARLVPRIAIPLVEILKPVMSPQTRDILQVYGTNPKEWKPILLKLIPRDQLRANLGGTKPE